MSSAAKRWLVECVRMNEHGSNLRVTYHIMNNMMLLSQTKCASARQNLPSYHCKKTWALLYAVHLFTLWAPFIGFTKSWISIELKVAGMIGKNDCAVQFIER